MAGRIKLNLEILVTSLVRRLLLESEVVLRSMVGKNDHHPSHVFLYWSAT